MQTFLFSFAICLSLTACNKSSPPPQKPVTPRSLVQLEMPLRPPLP